MYEGSLCGTTTDVSSHLVPSSSDSINNIIFSDDITTTTTNCTQHGQHRTVYHGVEEDGQDYFFTLSVSSQKKTWLIRRTYRDFRKFDRQLHKCVYDRKFSQLQELVKLEVDEDLHGPASLHEVEVRVPTNFAAICHGLCYLLLNRGTIFVCFPAYMKTRV